VTRIEEYEKGGLKKMEYEFCTERKCWSFYNEIAIRVGALNG